MLDSALSFASFKHQGQVDDSGNDYIYHPIQVANIIRMVTASDNNLIAAALLHDTIEDTNTTYEELVETFNKDVADLVMEVTHEGTKDKGYYFPRLKTQRGIMLKFADRLSNVSRMESWSANRQEHYLKKSKFWDAWPGETTSIRIFMEDVIAHCERLAKEKNENNNH